MLPSSALPQVKEQLSVQAWPGVKKGVKSGDDVERVES